MGYIYVSNSCPPFFHTMTCIGIIKPAGMTSTSCEGSTTYAKRGLLLSDCIISMFFKNAYTVGGGGFHIALLDI